MPSNFQFINYLIATGLICLLSVSFFLAIALLFQQIKLRNADTPPPLNTQLRHSKRAFTVALAFSLLTILSMGYSFFRYGQVRWLYDPHIWSSGKIAEHLNQFTMEWHLLQEHPEDAKQFQKVKTELKHIDFYAHAMRHGSDDPRASTIRIYNNDYMNQGLDHILEQTQALDTHLNQWLSNPIDPSLKALIITQHNRIHKKNKGIYIMLHAVQNKLSREALMVFFPLLVLCIPLTSLTVYYFHRQQKQKLQELNQALSYNERLKSEIDKRKSTEIQLKEAKELAEKANQYKTRFLAHVSHEVKNPMNTIVGMAELIKTHPLNEQQTQYLAVFEKTSHHLLQILDDILDTAAIESGKLQLFPAYFSLHSFLDHLSNLYNTALLNRDLVFSMHVDPETPNWVLGDERRLWQVFGNLINNAFKFTEKGTITFTIKPINISPTTCLMEFSLADTGTGMSEKTLGSIFDPFEQGDTSLDMKAKGMGLGLNIVRQFMDLMQGSIDVKSKLGKGSVFTVKIPFKYKRNKDSTSPVLQSKDTSDAQTPKTRILVAEDDIHNEIIFENIFAQYAIDVVFARDEKTAYDLAVSTPFDVIMLDIQMPVMNGIKVVERIREHEKKSKHAAKPIIAITALNADDLYNQCIQAGFDELLIKPIYKQKLMETLKQYLA